MARTQRNKATASHLGLLKARLAKLRRELLTPKGGGGGPGEGFDVAKTGDARIGFVGGLCCWFMLWLIVAYLLDRFGQHEWGCQEVCLIQVEMDKLNSGNLISTRLKLLM